MQSSILSQVESYLPNSQVLPSAPQQKKKFLLKNKFCHPSSKPTEQYLLTRYFQIYNIIYLDLHLINDAASNQCSFPQQIFKNQPVAKVFKNRDRIILNLKLFPKITKSTVPCPNFKPLTLEGKDCQNYHFSYSAQMLHLVQLSQKINQFSLQQKANKENLLSNGFISTLYLSEQEVSQRTENLISNRKSPKYIIMENMFQQNCKKIKNIHISSPLLETLGYLNETLAFEILEKRALPFKVFKTLDYRTFAQNVLKHFTRLLESYLSDGELQIPEESFKMPATIQTQDHEEKQVTLKWTCSHPAIILLEILENYDQMNQTDLGIFGLSGIQEACNQFGNLKLE